jgi:chromosome partitioning protein
MSGARRARSDLQSFPVTYRQRQGGRVAAFAPLGSRELKDLAAELEALTTRMQAVGLFEDQPKTELIKSLRLFPVSEARAYLDVKRGALFARLGKDRTLPQGDRGDSQCCAFSIEEIHTLQLAMGLPPRRPPGSLPLTIAVCNLVRGGGKTVTAVHLSQYLCLRGYRVLMIDLDESATLSKAFGCRPPVEAQATSAFTIQRTRWPGLDLIAGTPGRADVEMHLVQIIPDNFEILHHDILKQEIETVRDQYDVVVLDTGCGQGFVNLNAVYAADIHLIPVNPTKYGVASLGVMFDFMAKSQELIERVKRVSERRSYAYAIQLTQFNRSDWEHPYLAALIRTSFPGTLTNEMPYSRFLQRVEEGLSLYEADRKTQAGKYRGASRAFKNDLESMTVVNRGIEATIQAAWTS